MNNTFKVDLSKLIKMRNDLQECVNKCGILMKKCYQIIDNTEQNYKTPTANYFRENANGFIVKSQRFVERDLMYFVDKLDEIIKIYDEMNKKIEASVKGRR